MGILVVPVVPTELPSPTPPPADGKFPLLLLLLVRTLRSALEVEVGEEGGAWEEMEAICSWFLMISVLRSVWGDKRKGREETGTERDESASLYDSIMQYTCIQQ